MSRSTTERSGTASSNDKYDLEIDDTPLSQEEVAMLMQIEQDCQETAPSAPQQSPGTSPVGSPATKRQKRSRRSASPHVTPSRLRSSVKPTARALDAGFKPNVTHTFRQGPHSSAAAASTELGTSIGAVAADTRRSESMDPLNMTADTARRSESTGPMAPMQPGGFGHPSSMGMAVGDSRRSNSAGPMGSMQPGGFGHPGAMGDHLGHYHSYPMPPHFGAYPAPGQHHSHSMPPPYFQPPSSMYGGVHPQQFHPHAHQFRDAKRLPADMPVEGPPADVFSPQYSTAEPQRPLQASALQASAAQPTSSTHGSTSGRSMAISRSPTPARSSTSTRDTTTSTKGAIHEPTEPSKPLAPTIPSVIVQPATPMPAVPQGSTDPGLHEGAEQEKDAIDIIAQLEESPTVGRISKAAREALRRGFSELDAAVKRISSETGLNPTQIVERWDLGRTRVASSWNIYQGYFEEQREQELARLEPEKQPLPGAVPDKATVSACYKLFQAAKPDTHDDVLRAYHQLRQMSDISDMSLTKRAREFKRHVEKIDTLIRNSSSFFGFESICITVGGVINQDHNLAQIVGTDASIDFFLERFRSTDIVALAQMKAHVYDRLSKRMAIDGDDDAESNADLTVKEEPGPVVVETIDIIRNRLIALAAHHKITITKGSALAWKNLPQIVAAKGCVFVNWPEDVPFPCEEKGTGNSKGISILKLPARALLLAAFDHPTHPLILEKKYKTAVPEDQPVIVGVPPDANSPYRHGRRRFLSDKRPDDRKGPPRLRAAPSTERKATVQKPISRTSQQEAPLPPTKDHSDNDEDDDRAPPPASKLKPTSKRKAQVHFIESDELEGPDAPYDAAEDGSPKYSGTEDEMPIARSPHLLRPKRTSKAKAAGKKKAAPKPSSKKRSRPSTDEDEDDDHNSEASIVDVDAGSDYEELTSKVDKKRRIQPTAPESPLPKKPASSTLKQSHAGGGSATDKPAAPKSPLPPKLAASTLKQSRAGDRSATDKVAEMLFSTAPAVAPASRSTTPPLPAPAPPAPIPSAPAPPPTSARTHFPQQQAMDRPQSLQPPAPWREGYYAGNYPPPFAESYNGHYMHPEGPPSWNPALHQGPPGWYAPGPGNPPLPSSSDLQAAPGPMQHAGYWAHQGHPGYANSYAHYPPPNMHPSYPLQDETSRASGDGQAGPSHASGDGQAGPSRVGNNAQAGPST